MAATTLMFSNSVELKWKNEKMVKKIRNGAVNALGFIFSNLLLNKEPILDSKNAIIIAAKTIIILSDDIQLSDIASFLPNLPYFRYFLAVESIKDKNLHEK